MRPASPISVGATSASASAETVRLLAAARGASRETASRVNAAGENGASSNVMQSASSFEKSRMSFRIRKRLSPEERIVSTTSR